MNRSTGPVLLHVFPSFRVGGAQVRFTDIVNHFRQRYRHVVVAMDGQLECRERLAPGLDISFPEVAVHKGDTLGNIRRFRAVLRSIQPDVLVTSNWGSIEWAVAKMRLPDIRHIHMEDGFGPEERACQLRRRVWARRLLLRNALTVVPSQTLYTLARDIWRLDIGRLRHIPNGIDTSHFTHPARGAAQTGIPVIGTVASLRAEKNVARLLQAFALVRRTAPAKLIVLGDGEELPALRTLASQIGIAADVCFTGHIRDIRSWYEKFDLFALSSDTEQMPLSVLEAMAAGLTVAATDVGDVASMLHPDNRSFVTPLQAGAEALSSSLLTLMADDALRAAIGTANRCRAEHLYSQEAMFDAYAGIFVAPRASHRPAQHTETISTAAQEKYE